VNLNVETLGQQHHIVHIEIAPEDYGSRFNKALKDVSKKAQIPGFRPGHVPAGMVRKMYGESVLLDELYRMVNDQMNNWLKENQYELLGDALPVPKDLGIDHNQEKSYTFSYEVGIQPQVEVESVLRNAAAFTRYRIPATETEIQAETERLSRKFGERKDVDAVEENDVVYAHATECNADGTEKEGGLSVDTYFNIQMLNEGQENLFLGAKTGEEKNIDDIFNVFRGDKVRIAKNILQQTEATAESVEGFSPAFRFRIDRIARLYPAEMNEDFFASVSKEIGPVANTEELHEKIRNAIESYNDQMTDTHLENTIFNFLMDNAQVPLPEAFLEKWYAATNKEEPSSEETADSFKTFITNLKQSLVYRTVQRTHAIEVSNEEIFAEAEAQVMRSYGQLGDDFVRYILQSQLKEKEFVENMHNRAAQKKFFAALRGYVSLEEQPITIDEFKEISQPKEEIYAS